MSLGESPSRGRRLLGDITNVKQEGLGLGLGRVRKSMAQQEKGGGAVPPPPNQKDFAKLLMENTALLRLIGERNQIIEYSNLELQKLRVTMQKLQQQNWQLAQANTQMLAELNMGKDRLKELQHQLKCAQLVIDLKIKKPNEVQNLPNDTICKNDQSLKCDELARVESVEPSVTSSKYPSKNQAMLSSTTSTCQVTGKDANKRSSTRKKSCGLKSNTCESTSISSTVDPVNKITKFSTASTLQVTANDNNKRRSVRKKSIDRKHQACESTCPITTIDPVTEDEDQDRNLMTTADSNANTVPTEDEGDMNKSNTSSPVITKKDGSPSKRKASSLPQGEELPRSSTRRSLRRSTSVGVSYKEIPINLKMRRE